MKPFSHERLKNLKRLVTHADCPDGYASAAIIRACLPKIEIEYLMPGTAAHANRPATPDTIFCDLTPPRERIWDFLQTKTIVLDHHEHQRDIVEAFGDDGVYSDKPGVSGAGLAYRYVYLIVWDDFIKRWDRGAGTLPPSIAHTETFARLIGTRDTWQTESPDWNDASALSAAVMLMGRTLDSPDGYLSLMAVGRSLIRKRERDAEEATIQAMSCLVGDRVVAVTNDMNLRSDIAEYIGLPADLVVAFRYFMDTDDKLKLKISMRTKHDDVDCGHFASTRDGGGHRKSASYHVEIVGAGSSPLQIIEAELCEFFGESIVKWGHSSLERAVVR